MVQNVLRGFRASPEPGIGWPAQSPSPLLYHRFFPGEDPLRKIRWPESAAGAVSRPGRRRLRLFQVFHPGGDLAGQRTAGRDDLPGQARARAKRSGRRGARAARPGRPCGDPLDVVWPEPAPSRAPPRHSKPSKSLSPGEPVELLGQVDDIFAAPGHGQHAGGSSKAGASGVPAIARRARLFLTSWRWICFLRSVCRSAWSSGRRAVPRLTTITSPTSSRRLLEVVDQHVFDELCSWSLVGVLRECVEVSWLGAAGCEPERECGRSVGHHHARVSWCRQIATLLTY